MSAREKAMERAEYVLQESWGDLEFHRQRVDDQKDALDERSQALARAEACLLYTSPSPRDGLLSRMPSSA